MGPLIKLDLPDEVYASLHHRAEQCCKTVEQFAAECLSAGAQTSEDDPLLQLAGVLESDLTDVAERHDYYIG